MSMFTCLILCAVAVSLSNVHAAVVGGQSPSLIEAFGPAIEACSKKHGVSDDDIQTAKTAGSSQGIEACFIDCVLKKAEFVNSKVEIDINAGLSNLRKVIPDDEQYAKYAEVGKQCASVNDKAVSEGKAGCEKSELLAACFLEYRADIPI